MTGPRFSISDMMGIVAIAAFGSAFVRLILPIVHPGFVGILVGCAVLFFGMLRAMVSDRRARAYWLGFSAAGWIWILSSLHVSFLMGYVALLDEASMYSRFDACLVVHTVILTVLFVAPTLWIARSGGSLAEWFFASNNQDDESTGD